MTTIMHPIRSALKKAQEKIEQIARPFGLNINFSYIFSDLTTEVTNLTTITESTARISIFIQGKQYDIVFTKTHVYIGCECHTWDHWYAQSKEIGLSYKLTLAEIDRIVRLSKIVQEHFGDQ